MDDATPTDFPAACSRVQRKLEHWRQRHRRGARIPEELWRAAAELAGAHGINRTARALRLDYYSLQKRAVAVARQRLEEGMSCAPKLTHAERIDFRSRKDWEFDEEAFQ